MLPCDEMIVIHNCTALPHCRVRRGHGPRELSMLCLSTGGVHRAPIPSFILLGTLALSAAHQHGTHISTLHAGPTCSAPARGPCLVPVLLMISAQRSGPGGCTQGLPCQATVCSGTESPSSRSDDPWGSPSGPGGKYKKTPWSLRVSIWMRIVQSRQETWPWISVLKLLSWGQIISCLWPTSMSHGHIHSAQNRRIKSLQEWTFSNTRLLDLEQYRALWTLPQSLLFLTCCPNVCFAFICHFHFSLPVSLDTPSQGSLPPPTLQESRRSQKCEQNLELEL